MEQDRISLKEQVPVPHRNNICLHRPFAGPEQFHYRLKQIDRDGAFTYSSVVEADRHRTEQSYWTRSELSQSVQSGNNDLAFRTATAGMTKLTVMDMLGREVAILINGTISAGDHSASFNASVLGSGIYFYRLETPGFTKTMKMTLVK
jgi:hypothetical protein